MHIVMEIIIYIGGPLGSRLAWPRSATAMDDMDEWDRALQLDLLIGEGEQAPESLAWDQAFDEAHTKEAHAACALDDEASWAEAYDEEVGASQEEEAEVLQTTELKADSASESGESSSSASWESSSSIRLLRIWWAQMLYQAVIGLERQWPGKLNRPLRVVSGCTGCSPEAAVLKARGRGDM